MKSKEQKLKRFSAALLFQFRVMVDRSPGKRRICEKRIIHFKASNAQRALVHAKKRGHEGEHSYKNSAGNKVFFEFIGVRDLLCCSDECDSDEVWYQILELVQPMERRKKLIPAESQLCAIRNND